MRSTTRCSASFIFRNIIKRNNKHFSSSFSSTVTTTTTTTMASLQTAAPFPWVPQQRDMRRFVSDAVQLAKEARLRATSLKSDFGPGLPASRPEKPSIYVVEPAQARGSFRRYMGIARDEWPLLAASVGCVFVYSVATLAIPHGFGTLIDYASRGDMPWSTSSKLISWFGIAGIGNFGRLALVGVAGERVIARLRQRLYQAIISQPSPFFDDPQNRTGALTQRLTSDTTVVGASLTESLSQGAKNVVQAIGSLAVMLYLSPPMTAMIVVLLPPVAMFAGVYGRYVNKISMSKQDSLANAGAIAEERLGNARTVKAFARETDEVNLFAKRVTDVFKVSRHMVVFNASYVAFLHVSGYMTLYCILWGGSLLVAANDLTPGVLFSFMLYTIYCGIGIMGMTNLVTDINKGYGASVRMFEILDKYDAQVEQEEAEIARQTGGASKTLTKLVGTMQCRGNFSFENVDFFYPTRPDVQIYSGLNLELRAGQCVCIVGASGGGKSTMGLLLLKLYQATGGQIKLDGHDINTLDTKWLRSIIGYVPQEPVLFGGTVAQNIAYGLGRERDWEDPVDNWTMSAVLDAAKRANAHDFICALPEQYNTFCGEGGRSLSGGQKQRIAISRALIKNPQLLILDEATSALDSESEKIVADAIERLVQDARRGGVVEEAAAASSTSAENNENEQENTTTSNSSSSSTSGGGGGGDSLKKRVVLMFAHRLSMIRHADVVVVLDKGSVAHIGSFEEVSKTELFRELTGLEQKQEKETGEAEGKKNTDKNNTE